MAMEGKQSSLGALIGAGRTAEVFHWGEGQVIQSHLSQRPAEAPLEPDARGMRVSLESNTS